jgi:cytochrome c553
MIKQVAFVAVLVCFSFASRAGHLEPALDLPTADVEAGKQKAKVCATCHGADGNSPNPIYPSLAGQVPGYIAAQLSLFKSNKRVNDIMRGMVAGLSTQDLADLDAYYSTQEITPGSVSEEEKESVLRGQRLYRGGYAPLQVAACISCHGPQGRGVPIRYPRVAGQHRKYLEDQLLTFKASYETPEAGTRFSYGDIMTRIAFLLSDRQIKDVSAYMHAMH